MICEYLILTDTGAQLQKGVKINEYFAIAPVFYENTLPTGWCVTHLPSGRYVWGFNHRVSAVKFVRRASGSWDWGKWEKIPQQESVCRLINECL